MRLIIIFSISVVLLSCGSKTNNNSDQENKLPNILIFVGDDMTWSDCEPYGSSEVKTPNIQNTSFFKLHPLLYSFIDY